MDILQNQYIQVIATLAGLLSAPLVVWQIIREVIIPVATGVRKTKSRSRVHLKNVTGLSRENPAYMSACVLIHLVRILASFFCVTASILMVIAALFLHLSGVSNPVFDVVSIAFLVLSSVFLLGLLMSAKRFSDRVRKDIAPDSLVTRSLF
ncbi:MAG TPA: hypothetical protein VEC11_00270 [Allosphingosinicella sp.]|nr:hypothetical protein [Allosphingosinicella sp.]